ncbi:MAG TPA: MinD/ParA family protein [Spirochaetota bacterium]|nr:MinD/ParA family protein [Spirochaetota bacterium]HOM38578.1 MinD/ParA family protein [Spirochaetota bacterium]HPQ49715.1 MinD/ParA family protein [Spirochaetota bacterium]
MSQIDGLIKMVNEENEKRHSKKNITRVISVASGKGGVGKTNVSVNIAIAYSQLGKKVLLMDADLGLANVNILLGIIPNYTLYDVISNKKSLEEIIIKYKENLDIIPGASGFYQIADLSREEKDNLINSLNKLASYDIIIIDSGAGLSDNVLSFITASNEVIVVTNPEPTALTDAYGLVKAISLTSEETEIKIVVNMIKDIKQAKTVYKKLYDVCYKFLKVEIKNLGFVYEDEAVKASVKKQNPFILSYPDSKASQSIKHIVLRLEKLDHILENKKGIKNFLEKLFK